MESEFENTDDRKPLDWKTRYEAEARKEILGEAIYLSVLFFSAPVFILGLWLGWFRFETLGMSPDKYPTVCCYSYAWLAGMLGGTMFSVKWLYHAVARGFWNHDRRLWRVFCPHLSGALAFAFLTVVTSGLIKTIDVTSLQKPAAIVACSFLVGYFSDSAIGKLREVAEILFGTRRDFAEGRTKAQKDKTSKSEPNKEDKPSGGSAVG